MNDLLIDSIHDVFCPDCDNIVSGKYKGETQNKEYMFVCERCGCEIYENEVGV